MDLVGFARILGLDSVLREQDGLIRRDQAIATGMTRARIDDLVRRERWIAVLPRTYLVGHSTDDPRVRIRACWLWAGDRSTIGGAAAAWWLRISPEPPATITVMIPPNTRRTTQPGIRVVRGTVANPDALFEDWIRVTSVARTCLDLAREGGPDRLEDAIRLRRVDPPRLQKSLDRSRHRRGQVNARKAVAAVSDNPWSPSERLAHALFKAAGITGWVANAPVHLRAGLRYPDIAIEELKLAIEIDGRQHHTREQDFENDRVRDNEFAEQGWTVLHFTWRQLTQEPERTVAIVKSTIERLRAARQSG